MKRLIADGVGRFIFAHWSVLLILTLTSSFAQSQVPTTTPAAAEPSRRPLNPNLPTVFVVGDSTASNGARNGWGDPFVDYFDPAKVNAANRAKAGRSSRTFVTEGLWDGVLKEMKAGDYVLIQMGQNDGRDPGTAPYRGTLPGIGEETREVKLANGDPYTVHTFGWYIRKYINETKAKGATPIVMSLTAKDLWTADGKNRRPYDKYPEWDLAIAKAENVQFLDHINIMGDQFDKMGQEKVHPLFQDSTHTKPEGADLNAAGVIAGLKALKSPLADYLSEKGKAVPAYQPASADAK